MEKVSSLLQEMQKQGKTANLITYSTMIKGFSQRGDVHKAFAILDEMRQTTDLMPDEIMYNTLLDACAQHGLLSEGEQIISQMLAQGISPSTYTLTVVTKLMCNARQVDRMFTLIQELSHKHNISLTASIYANMLNACIQTRDLPRAVKVFDQAVLEQQLLESRIWHGLVRACINAGNTVQAVHILSVVLGVPTGSSHPAILLYKNSDEAFIIESLTAITRHGGEGAAMAASLQEYMQPEQAASVQWKAYMQQEQAASVQWKADYKTEYGSSDRCADYKRYPNSVATTKSHAKRATHTWRRRGPEA